MSGIAGMVRSGGVPVDRELLATMTELLAARGPDAHDHWCKDSFGLSHSLFRTTDESQQEKQPFSLDGQVWITADARIDARQELVRRLRDCGRETSLSAPDVELILHAYHAWGTDCVQHLLGDFAFIVADTRQNRLFCARDHLGVKPLFYASTGEGLIVSNLLDCVRLHPRVSAKLNDSFVCDFLLFALNTDVAATVFTDIQRLPPAHTLTCSNNGTQIERYWSIAIPDEARGRSQQEQVDGFMEVFEKAVEDRLRTDRVVVSMSGGLDSASLAATALPLLKRRSPPGKMQAVTRVYDRIIPDRERYYAGLVAEHLGIPIDFVVCDDLEYFADVWDSPATLSAEPLQRGNLLDRHARAEHCQHSRVVLCGDGGDEAIYPPTRYYQALLRERRIGRWFLDCCRHIWSLRSLPPMGVRTLLYKRWLTRLRGNKESEPQFPDWIHPDLVRRLDLRDRWNRYWSLSLSSRVPGGYPSVSSFLQPQNMDWYAPTDAMPPIEFRFPFLDLRVLAYCWSLPPIPMLYAKQVLRMAMRGRLPEKILKRRKQSLAGDPLTAKANANEVRLPISWDDCVTRTPELTEYVHGWHAPLTSGSEQSGQKPSRWDIWMSFRAFELGSWLYHRRRSLPGSIAEKQTTC